jgi:hypothetical protein
LGRRAGGLAARPKSSPQLDLEHTADEVADLGKSARLKVLSRMVVLLAHLLKWSLQPDPGGQSWEKTIAHQGGEALDHLNDIPSLRPSLADAEWMDKAWSKATALAEAETELESEGFASAGQWTADQILRPDFLPV